MDDITFLLGNARDVLKTIPDESVHVIVTSSPYLGARAYGTTPQFWGGDLSCPHEWEEVHPPGYRGSDTNPGLLQSGGTLGREKLTSKLCKHCGAWMGELGLEPTPEMFIEHLVTIYHECKRVLRKDGIFWCNIGDATDDKSLIEIPSMLADALKKDGWYLRSRVPWIKRNSMPDSTSDRPGKSIEYFFLLSKSGTTQFWTHPTKPGVRYKPDPDYVYQNRVTGETVTIAPEGWKTLTYTEGAKEKKLWKRRNLWDGHDYYYDYVGVMQQASESYLKDARPKGVLRQRVNAESKYPDEGQYAKADPCVFKKQDEAGNNTYTGFNARYVPNDLGLRYMRDSDFFFRTWQGLLQDEDGEPVALVVNPKGFKGAHFAVFPERIAEPLIIAGSSCKGVCPVCGAPWTRLDKDPNGMNWVPSCMCGLGKSPIPATVLDPFNGAGTTGVVCLRHNRKYVGIELNPKYIEMSQKRIAEEREHDA